MQVDCHGVHVSDAVVQHCFFGERYELMARLVEDRGRSPEVSVMRSDYPTGQPSSGTALFGEQVTRASDRNEGRWR